MTIKKVLDVPGFLEYVEAIQSCGAHPLPGLTPAVLSSIRRVVSCYIEGKEDHDDTAGHIVVELENGVGGVFSEWSDSSGHG